MEDRSAGMPDPSERRMKARELIAHPAFVRVWLGQAVNVTGDAIFGVALALWLLDRHDSAHALGMALGSLAVGTVVSILIGGVLADRYRRSRVIVIADLVRMASLAALLLGGAHAHCGRSAQRPSYWATEPGYTGRRTRHYCLPWSRLS